MRKNGYYWVKQYARTQWETAEWSYGYWYFTGNENGYTDDELFLIDERVIVREG